MSDGASAGLNTVTRLWLAMTLLVASPMASSAQGYAQGDTQLRTRLVAAERSYRAANDSLRATREAHAAVQPPRDSVRAGALTILATTPLSSITRRTLQRASERAWNAVHLALGDSASAAIGGQPLLFGQDSSGTFMYPPRAHIWLSHGPGRIGTLRLPLSESAAADAMLERVGALASRRNPAQLRAWMGDWIPPRRFENADWAEEAVMLATANAAVARGCHAGAVSQCLSALALVPTKDPFTEWYAPEDWRVLAAAVNVSRWDLWPNAHVDCFERRLSDVCLRILRLNPVPQALAADARRSVVAYALQRGGPQAFARLIAADGTPLAILERTSGLSGDSLIAGWHATVVHATPRTVQPGALEATLLVGWTLLFGAAAGRRRP